MIFGDILTGIVCKLHELKQQREWRRGRAERKKSALRKKGWDDLYDHMFRKSAGAARQPVSLTAREAAVEAGRGEADVVRPEEGSVEALGVLPLARPPRKGDL